MSTAHYDFDINPPRESLTRGSGVQASNDNRCPCCDSPSWCFILDDGKAVICGRCDVPPDGWEQTGTAKDGRAIYAKAGSRQHERRYKGLLPSPSDVVLKAHPRTDFPQWVEIGGGELQIHFEYSDPVTGEPVGRVERKQYSDRRRAYNNGKDSKQIRPHHWVKPHHPDQGDQGWWSDRGKGLVTWPLYREGEARDAIASNLCNILFNGTGEQSVETYRRLGLYANCAQGGEGTGDAQIIEFLKRNTPRVFVIAPDEDKPGHKASAKLQEGCNKANLPAVTINLKNVWSSLPPKGDITDILAGSGMSESEIVKRLEAEIRRAIAAKAEIGTPDSFDPDIEFPQKARRELYRDKPWICVNNILHYWTGNHYKASLDVVEAQRLWHYCNGYAVDDGQGNLRYPYASPSAVKKALEWIKMAYGVDPTLINPAGLNCTNGVLQLFWVEATPSWRLVDHDPALYYTYEPVVSYNANADSINCDRLLEVLDAPQRQVFLRTIAASLDLATVRIHKGRLVRALLLKGHGANGKDSLREAVAAMYGYQSITSASLTDFASYDEGRKFPLARLAHSRINWSSENANFDKLDKIQSLKAFITGDPISIEAKGRDEHEFTPVGIGLFNVNDTPNLQASSEAIQSRYGVLTFSKTFKICADSSKGEIEADPRFKYDPNFLRSEILPAFLNRVLAALTDLMAKGIDYRCTEQALQDIQAENSHLFQFAQDTGLTYDPASSLGLGEIWERLKQWYIDNGTLTIETSDGGKQKSVWIDQVKKSDPNVKGSNQVLARFVQLFPKAKRSSLGDNKVGIHGLAFKISQFAPEISQSLASGLASNPDTARKISQISQFSNSDENNSKINSAQRDCAAESQSQGEKLANLPNPPDTARLTGSSMANKLANPPEQVANPEESLIKVGDRVEISCPGSKRDQKQGTVVRTKVQRSPEGDELKLAVVHVDGEKQNWDAQLRWLTLL